MIYPLNKRIVLQKILEKKTFKDIIIPKNVTFNELIFAKIIALPKEELDTKTFKVGQIVVLGWSPVWERKFTVKYNNEDYIIINEYSILATIDDNDIDDLIDEVN